MGDKICRTSLKYAEEARGAFGVCICKLMMIHVKVLSANLLFKVEKRLSAFLNTKNLVEIERERKSVRVEIKQNWERHCMERRLRAAL